MKTLMTAAMMLLAAATAAQAQATPDLKGTWSGQFRTVILGSNPHHPPGGAADTPRVRELAFTFEIEGQDGRLLWGKSWSHAELKEPFVATITWDGRTIIGADTDGSLSMRIGGGRRMDLCYIHPATSPSQSMVASCGVMQRTPAQTAATAPPAAAQTSQAEPLLSTSTTVLGETLRYPKGAAHVTSEIIALAPGERTIRHKHGVPMFFYILEGEITVDYGPRGKRTYLKGQSAMEEMGVAHFGENTGKEPMRLIVVYMGAGRAKDVIPVQ